MKAHIKATGEIVNVYNWGEPTLRADNGDIYQRSELDFDVEDENNPGYWTRLEHQYVGMAMQGLMSILPQVGGIEGRSPSDEVSDMSITIATKLIEKLREERK